MPSALPILKPGFTTWVNRVSKIPTPFDTASDSVNDTGNAGEERDNLCGVLWMLVSVVVASIMTIAVRLVTLVTRESRAVSGLQRIATDYEAKLAFVLDAYVSDGIGELDRKKLPDLLELKYSSATEGAAELGGPAIVAKAFVGFQMHLFQE